MFLRAEEGVNEKFHSNVILHSLAIAKDVYADLEELLLRDLEQEQSTNRRKRTTIPGLLLVGGDVSQVQYR